MRSLNESGLYMNLMKTYLRFNVFFTPAGRETACMHICLDTVDTLSPQYQTLQPVLTELDSLAGE